jgi:hypothetical protein
VDDKTAMARLLAEYGEPEPEGFDEHGVEHRPDV